VSLSYRNSKGHENGGSGEIPPLRCALVASGAVVRQGSGFKFSSLTRSVNFHHSQNFNSAPEREKFIFAAILHLVERSGFGPLHKILRQ
jgi:hypothetical protein